MGSRATRLAKPAIAKMTAEGECAKHAKIQRVDSFLERLHEKARCEIYPRTQMKRFKVEDKYVKWNVEYPDYTPVVYTSEGVLKGPVWADPDLLTTKADIKWNAVQNNVSRVSHMGPYRIEDNLPRNPIGRTGVKGRGCLGRWGPNHAADPIVTRWRRSDNNVIEKGEDSKNILQFVAVQRRDNHQWAIPGGMVDPGEVITATLKREFGEEAMNTLEMSEEKKDELDLAVNDLFLHGEEVYRGYVDDPRNTDNSWMETVALNFHDESGTGVSKIELNAGDDAVGVKWMDLTSKLKIYASHIDFLQVVAKRHNASW
ncbi:ADP-ribose pyrophosphatase, mitochondrial-like isoform X2 [Mizuhopecten yessoensis]|nr:ADP-ribose pyrophosphatase, mitochondrial-like isoform X2 [Mizuhopecten yessoensis]